MFRLKACFHNHVLDSGLTDFSSSKNFHSDYKGCFMQLRDFRWVRRFLTPDASIFLAILLLVVS